MEGREKGERKGEKRIKKTLKNNQIGGYFVSGLVSTGFPSASTFSPPHRSWSFLSSLR